MSTAAATTPSPNRERLRVKQVLFGDTVVLQETPKDGPPKERTVSFTNVIAPKVARGPRTTGNPTDETKDEPWAWESREFLRKKLVGEFVWYEKEKEVSPTKEYGTVYLEKETAQENVTLLMVREGLVSVKRDVRRTEDLEALWLEEDNAKTAKKGKWSEDKQSHVRDVKWTIDNARAYYEKHKHKPIDAIIEYVRDGSTVRAILLPDYQMVTVMIAGIRCPTVKTDNNEHGNNQSSTDIANEAKYIVEKLLLQRDIKIILESTSNNNFIGTIVHPRGNIAEILLESGVAQCVDWSMSLVSSGAERLRQAEEKAKKERRRLWANYVPPQTSQLSGKEKGFQGVVVEVINADALMVKAGNTPPKKIFLASIRAPRGSEDAKTEGAPTPTAPANKGPQRVSRPLYDIPWMFEAREHLRKKLIGKKVNVTVDFKQPASDKFPEKVCCTVTIGGVNVAESLLAKGLATVVRYRPNDDQRASQYDTLLAAEAKAQKAGLGVHGAGGNKKEGGQIKVTDIAADAARARTTLSSLQRYGRVDAVVEAVTSGSRLRLYIPRDMQLITFLLAGINCPRGARRGVDGGPALPSEPFGDDALAFTREKTLQHDVQVQVDSTDKAGNFIGWLWVDGSNISVALVAEGLATVHFSAEKSEHCRALRNAENSAKSLRVNLWKDYVDEEKKEEKIVEEDTVVERKVDQKKVAVVEVSKDVKDLKFYAQFVDQGPKLESLMGQIRQEFLNNPPLSGAYTPRRGDLCAAQFSDDEWYRARVERVHNNQVHVYFIDYGNRLVTSPTRCATLSAAFTADKPYAHEYGLAFVKLPRETEDQDYAITAFRDDVEERTLMLNEEYHVEKLVYATLACPEMKTDIGKALVTDGFLMVEMRRDRRLQKVVSDYKAAQEEAKSQHKGIWQYGDITEDDAKEFGR